MESNEIILPFLKWAGGKRWLSCQPEFRIPEFKGRYIEPFLGGGSIFFLLKPKRAILSDLNRELISAYRALQSEHRKVIRHLSQHAVSHSSSHYYNVRDNFRPRSEAGKAARFLYLNRTCWNGLYRVNRLGKFNVPKGTKSAVLMDTDNFSSVALSLQRAELVCSDFEPIVDRATRGDFVYADPPYTVHHNANGFIKYNEVLFSWEDQRRLKDCLLRARKRGAKIMVSNADHTSIQELYRGIGNSNKISRASVISGNTKGRRVTTELLICF
jgi:DNA adenine methylase